MAATIEGNLYVEEIHHLIQCCRDNIILVNNQNWCGVTLHQAGFEIDRFTLETFRVVYNELNSRVEVIY
jgi:hypothetical protein